jgi:hypothetical protein
MEEEEVCDTYRYSSEVPWQAREGDKATAVPEIRLSVMSG